MPLDHRGLIDNDVVAVVDHPAPGDHDVVRRGRRPQQRGGDEIVVGAGVLDPVDLQSEQVGLPADAARLREWRVP